jgi:hypothetical protein
MISFILGILSGALCLAVYNELYTRWLYNDVKRRAKQQGISDRQMKDALVWAATEEIEESLHGRPATKR